MGSRDYSSSKIVGWLRKRVFKFERPYALPWGQWDVWCDETKKAHPIGYWVTEKLPTLLEKIPETLIDPTYEMTYRLRNRFVFKRHYIQTGLKAGEFYEFDTKVLNGLFTELVNYVEVEKAWMHSREDKVKKYKMPWYYRHWLTRWKEWRCAEAGIDHLKWEVSLKGEGGMHQSSSAIETVFLYSWWKEIYLKRKDTHDEVGLTDLMGRFETKYGDRWIWRNGALDPEDKALYDKLRAAQSELEKQQDDEETEMLIRLIKIRKYLWT